MLIAKIEIFQDLVNYNFKTVEVEIKSEALKTLYFSNEPVAEEITDEALEDIAKALGMEKREIQFIGNVYVNNKKVIEW